MASRMTLLCPESKEENTPCCELLTKEGQPDNLPHPTIERSVNLKNLALSSYDVILDFRSSDSKRIVRIIDPRRTPVNAKIVVIIRNNKKEQPINKTTTTSTWNDHNINMERPRHQHGTTTTSTWNDHTRLAIASIALEKFQVQRLRQGCPICGPLFNQKL